MMCVCVCVCELSARACGRVGWFGVGYDNVYYVITVV